MNEIMASPGISENWESDDIVEHAIKLLNDYESGASKISQPAHLLSTDA